MLCQTHLRRQSAGGLAGGLAESARMTPRGADTTASAAPPIRSDQEAAAPDSGGAGRGLCPEWERARCARIFRMTAGSWRVAIKRSRPPQWPQARTSIAKEHSSYCTSYRDVADGPATPARAGVDGLGGSGSCSLAGRYKHSPLSLQRRASRWPLLRQHRSVSRPMPSSAAISLASASGHHAGVGGDS